MLRTGGLTDISGLVGLAKNDLVHLAFRNNTIVDASPLAAIPSLEFLDLSLNEITDISALTGLTNLRYVDLSNNPNVSPEAVAALEAKGMMVIMNRLPTGERSSAPPRIQGTGIRLLGSRNHNAKS